MKTNTAISKITALLLSLILVVGMTPTTAFAAETAPLGTSAQPMGGEIGTFAHEPENAPLGELGGLLYTSLGGDNAKVSGYDPVALPADVVIPATVTFGGDTYNVTEIDNIAFFDCQSLTTVTIPNSVTIIGDYAFASCTSLTTVTIPNSVTIIGDYAFASCTGLTSVTIPNSVTTIGGYVFSGCTSLTSITIPNSVTTIGDYAFNSCYSLTSITIPDSVTTIGDAAFYECTSLTSITIPNSVTTIGGYVFASCTGLTSVTIPDSVTTIGDAAFYECTSLTTVTIPNSVTTIGDAAFYYCTGLTSVTIPDSVKTIGSYAFSYCRSLESMSFLSAIPPSIGVDVFSDCTALTTINVPLGSEAAYKTALPDYASLVVGVDMTPPTGSGSSSSSSSSGGSNKPDTRPIVGGTTTGATTTSKPLTKTEATKQFDTALAVKPAGGTTLSIKVRNATSVSKEVLAELAAAAKKNGVTLTVHFDTVVGGKVVSRLSVNPATATGDLDLTIKENKALAALFAKYYSNQLAAYTIPAAGSVAIKLPENLKAEGLVLYSYDPATNTYSQIQNAKPWVDTNGYLHFDIVVGGDVVISQRELLKK